MDPVKETRRSDGLELPTWMSVQVQLKDPTTAAAWSPTIRAVHTALVAAGPFFSCHYAVIEQPAGGTLLEITARARYESSEYTVRRIVHADDLTPAQLLVDGLLTTMTYFSTIEHLAEVSDAADATA